MSLHPELEIAQLLKVPAPDVKRVGETLLKRAFDKTQPLDRKRIEAYANFFLNTGQISLLLRFCIQLLFESHPLCWGELVEALGILATSIPSEKRDLLLELGKRQSLVESLVKSHGLDAQEPRIAELREKLNKKRRVKREKRRSDLIQKFEILKHDSLLEECQKILHELLLDSPGNPQFLRFQNELDNQKASHIIAKLQRDPLKKDWSHRPEVLTFEEEEIIRTLKVVLMELIADRPRRAIDFAILLLFLDCPRQGLEILALTPEEFSRDWLRFELLSRASQYVDLMSESYRLAQRYATDPETHFAASYGRALALWGLGQRESAISTMENIVKIRPDYRSAHTLLSNWKRELA